MNKIDELLRKENELNDKLEQKDKQLSSLKAKSENPPKETEQTRELAKMRDKVKESIFL